jgi:hypothetical protein
MGTMRRKEAARRCTLVSQSVGVYMGARVRKEMGAAQDIYNNAGNWIATSCPTCR